MVTCNCYILDKNNIWILDIAPNLKQLYVPHMILKLDNNKYDTTWAQKHYVLMGLTYSNKVYGNKHARKNNVTDNWKTTKSTLLEFIDLQ